MIRIATFGIPILRQQPNAAIFQSLWGKCLCPRQIQVIGALSEISNQWSDSLLYRLPRESLPSHTLRLNTNMCLEVR